MEAAGVDWARTTQCPQEFWASRVPVDLDEGGDLASSIDGGDLERVPDPWVFEVDAPSRSGVNVRLWACRGRGALFFLIETCRCFNCGLSVELDQRIDGQLKERRGGHGERSQGRGTRGCGE